MAEYGWFFGRDGRPTTRRRTRAAPTPCTRSSEDETIARLATGIKRFKLPDEFNYIKIYQQVADEPKTGSARGALEQLAQIFENRRQYPKAAEYWRQADQGVRRATAATATGSSGSSRSSATGGGSSRS